MYERVVCVADVFLFGICTLAPIFNVLAPLTGLCFTW